jgi:hypothetical protein
MESDRMITVDDTDGAPEGCIAIVVRGTTNVHERRDPYEGPHPEAESGVPPSIVIYFREVLTEKSCYLSALLESGMKEAQARRVDLTRLGPTGCPSRFAVPRRSDGGVRLYAPVMLQTLAHGRRSAGCGSIRLLASGGE